jgi:acyl-CoA thioesterase-2
MVERVTDTYVVPARDLPPEGVSLRELLTLERLDADFFRSQVLFREEWSLFGGQVFAQALAAAGRTVEADRAPHSAHAYFLRPGDPTRPVLFQVARDRDGRSLSARRVVALQDGHVILNLAASFAPPAGDQTDQIHVPAHAVPPPGATSIPARLVGFEQSIPPQEHPNHSYPSRAWFRVTADVPSDPLTTCMLMAYLSDLYGGAGALPDSAVRLQPTIDHSIRFHRLPTPGAWILSDMRLLSVSDGRACYAGNLWDEAGALVASFSQECLYR